LHSSEQFDGGSRSRGAFAKTLWIKAATVIIARRP
jgi:hypothetical protein